MNITEENFKEAKELVHLIKSGSRTFTEAMKDGQVNWHDAPNLFPFIYDVIAGFDGIEKVVPVFLSNEPSVVERLEQIFAEEFRIEQLRPAIEAAVRNIVLHLNGIVSNVFFLMTYAEAEN